jgi:pectin methylesterase-like acyl-CoA thioesterase
MKRYWILFICFAYVSTAFAQYPATATWALTGTTLQTSAVVGYITAASQKFSTGDSISTLVVKNWDAGSAGAMQRCKLQATNWPQESAEVSTRYQQYDVTPTGTNQLDVTSLSFDIGYAGTTNHMQVNVYYSTDNWATQTKLNSSAVYAANTALTSPAPSFTFAAHIAAGGTFSVRISPWYDGAASATKYICIKNVVISGTTPGVGTPATVGFSSIANLASSSVTINGIVSDSGSSSVTARGTCYGASAKPDILGTFTTDGSGVGAFSSSLTGLTPGKTYHVRTYATNGSGTSYSADTSFTTLAIAPTLTTVVPWNIGLTWVLSGGTISSNGGGTVTQVGVCWNTTGTPTIADSHTSDATATSFSSSATGLTASTKYYVRAYAVNSAGVGYGDEYSYTTLTTAVAPTVTTSAATNIYTNYATVAGKVTSEGGIAVTQRGVCWNTTGSPTISDKKSNDGSGAGDYVSYLSNLASVTTYYARAYAINTLGTSYGDQQAFTTLTASKDSLIVVAKDGSGNFTTVKEALNAVPLSYLGNTTILVKKGTYYEKDTIVANKSHLLIKGEDKDSTIITYDDYSGLVVGGVTIGTSTSQSVWVRANDVTFQDITIQNTSTAAQAVAINIQADRVAFINCNLLGYQDTYYTWNSGRVYNKNCLIAGTVDFIFGSGTALFDSCEIRERRNTGTLTAAATNANLAFGYVFKNCTITNDSIGYDGNAITSFYLGRPWQNYPQTVFINCYEPAAMNSDGWLSWNVTPTIYAEYNCSGPGYNPTARKNNGTVLTDAQAATYTTANILSRNSATPAYSMDWYVDNLVVTDVQEQNSPIKAIKSFNLDQNYPNPFNPSTKISFSLPETGIVNLNVYNVLGQKVASLINSESMTVGNHSVSFNASNLSSGVYFYSLKAGNNVITKKMMLVK